MNNTEKPLLIGVYSVYFLCGLAQCFEGIFLPEFKEHFSLTYTEQMYTMLAKNLPFACFSILIPSLINKIGFKNCLTVSLFLFAGGTALIVPGLLIDSYSIVLLAFFIIGTAFTVELVAGNPLLALLGPRATSASRLNIGNALGSVAQIVAPLFITLLIPKTINSMEGKLPFIIGIFIVTAVALVLMGIHTLYLGPVKLSHQSLDKDVAPRAGPSIWKEPKVVLGFISIFLVIGIEAGLFGFYRNYLEDPMVLGLTSHQSQQMFTVYFALFAFGRLFGSMVQRNVKASLTLAFNLIVSMVLVTFVVKANGWVAGTAITLMGFFVSTFFPTLYALAVEGLGERTAQASGLLVMGFLGAAIIPLVQGKVADNTSLSYSFMVAVVPYLFAFFYAIKGHTYQPSISSRV